MQPKRKIVDRFGPTQKPSPAAQTSSPGRTPLAEPTDLLNWSGKASLYRLTLPKVMIDSAGDDFFLPDSAQFYINDLLGVKYLRYVPNSNHSLSGTDAWDTLRACYSAFLTQAPLPQFSWTLQSPGVLQVVTTTAPSAVNLWQATNPNARDFRLTTIGPAYTSSTLSDQGGGTYIGNVATPSQGWTAFFIELTYPASLAQFKFTTQVYVVPDTLPCHFP